MNIVLAGIFGLASIPMIVGAYLYDKSPILSTLLIVIGLIIIIAVIFSHFYLKNKELDARTRGFIKSIDEDNKFRVVKSESK